MMNKMFQNWQTIFKTDMSSQQSKQLSEKVFSTTIFTMSQLYGISRFKKQSHLREKKVHFKYLLWRHMITLHILAQWLPVPYNIKCQHLTAKYTPPTFLGLRDKNV